MTSCPICQKPVDPLRTSFVRVIGVHVTPYCSAACRDADAARAVVSLAPLADDAAAAPAPVPVAAAKSGAVAASASAASSARASTAVPEPAKDSGKSSKASAVPEPAKDSGKSSKASAKEEARADAKPSKSDKADKAGKADDKASKADDKSAAHKTSEASSKTSEAAAKPASSDSKAAASTSKPAGSSKSQASDASASSSAAAPAEPAATSKLTAASKPATATEPATAKSASSSTSPSDDDGPRLVPEPRRRGVVFAVLLVLALGGIVVWRLALRSDPPPPPVKVAPQPPQPPPPPPPPPRFEPAAANERAVAVLREHFTVESLRVRRVAAAALARTGDKQALETLTALLPTEQSEIAKQDIAYGLARGGDPRGLEMLVNGMRSSRRDVKADAARLLATLKDERAETTLSSLQVLSQFRTSVVQQLARLGNKAAIAQLEKLRADEKATEEERKNAAIALGYAGQASVAEELRGLLPDTRFNVGAAGALAVLGDPAARATLIEQLSVPSLRVSAALALRRLEPGLDAAPILFRLMPDLESSKDTERVAAAEAVLLLTGPPTLAERD